MHISWQILLSRCAFAAVLLYPWISAAAPVEQIVGDWVHAQTGDRLTITSNASVTITPARGDVRQGSVAKTAVRGGNLAIEYPGGPTCLYFAALLQGGRAMTMR